VKTHWKWIAYAILSCGCIQGIQAAEPEAWPSRRVTMVVPFAPGGATDIVARILAPAMAEVLGQPVVVDNRPGASGNIGAMMVARAQPDGHTMVLSNVSLASINPILFAATLKMDLAKALTGVVLLASIPDIIVAKPDFPASNAKELVAHARAHPGKLNFSNPLGGYTHLYMLEWSGRTGMQLVNVPSKGPVQVVTSILGGEIHFSSLNSASITPHVQAGRLKALAAVAPQRLPALPEVPTLAESGYPGVGIVNWNGIFVPTGTPKPVIDRLHLITVKLMESPNIRQALEKAKVPVTLSKSPEDFQQFVRQELERAGRIIRENNISLESP